MALSCSVAVKGDRCFQLSVGSEVNNREENTDMLPLPLSGTLPIPLAGGRDRLKH